MPSTSAEASHTVRPLPRLALLFAAAAALSGFTLLRGVNVHDEGLMLQAAARIADGQLPWRDFWWNYGPGQPLLLAGLQEVLGPSLVAWRVLRVLLAAAVSVLAYVLARREASEPLALGAWLAVAGAMAFPALPSPTPAVLALGLGGIALAQRSPVAGGAVAGAAVFFRIELGLAAIAGAVLAASGGGRRDAPRAACAGALAGAVLLAPFAIAGGTETWDDTIGFVLGAQSLQRLPLPGALPGGFDLNKALEHFFPYVLLGGAAIWALAALRERPGARALALLPLALAGVLYLLGRADEFHLIPLAAVLPVMLAGAAQRELDAGRRLVAVPAITALVLIALHGLDRQGKEALHPPERVPLRAAVADGVRVDPAEARSLGVLIPYVDARVPPGGAVFVANPRHDLVNVGNPLVYVLLQRRNPTRYDVMQPGVVTEASAQREIVAALRRARPRLAVRWLSPLADQRQGNGAGRSSGVHLLDRYLTSAYRPDRRFGDYQVLTRRQPR
jgi:hypothetical protein